MAKKNLSPTKKLAQVEGVSVFGLEWRAAPFALVQYAKDFLDAFQRATPSTRLSVDPVRFYLVCHAIELLLKAELAVQGESVLALLEKHRHDLKSLLAAAEGGGMSTRVQLEEDMRRAIAAASRPYSEKVFEYPAIEQLVRDFPDRPDMEKLFQAGEVLAAALYEPCLHLKGSPAEP